MADKNPTAGPRVVPIDVPPAQETDQLPDPAADAREADAFRRLLTALDRGEIALPDDEAREAMSRAAEGYDDASGYERVVAVHDAHHALLSVLG
jgi:hypothetical protein